MFIEAHANAGLPCSLIICDIDHFKQRQRHWGHPAGDEVIRSFAQLLKSSCRSGDLVARYGGEEFVMLCADCNVATAFERAEQSADRLPPCRNAVLGGAVVTASFGVTETQPGDTRRNDFEPGRPGACRPRNRGRNLVVQLGAGGGMRPNSRRVPGGNSGIRAGSPRCSSRDLITTVPIKVTIEKLRGFVADQSAQVLTIEDSRICMMIQGGPVQFNRRSADRGTPLLLELSLAEEQVRGTHPP